MYTLNEMFKSKRVRKEMRIKIVRNIVLYGVHTFGSGINPLSSNVISQRSMSSISPSRRLRMRVFNSYLDVIMCFSWAYTKEGRKYWSDYYIKHGGLIFKK